jgi:hypothetical protein
MKKNRQKEDGIRSYLVGVSFNAREKKMLENLAKKQGLTKAGFLRVIFMREIEQRGNNFDGK